MFIIIIIFIHWQLFVTDEGLAAAALPAERRQRGRCMDYAVLVQQI